MCQSVRANPRIEFSPERVFRRDAFGAIASSERNAVSFPVELQEFANRFDCRDAFDLLLAIERYPKSIAIEQHLSIRRVRRATKELRKMFLEQFPWIPGLQFDAPSKRRYGAIPPWGVGRRQRFWRART